MGVVGALVVVRGNVVTLSERRSLMLKRVASDNRRCAPFTKEQLGLDLSEGGGRGSSLSEWELPIDLEDEDEDQRLDLKGLNETGGEPKPREDFGFDGTVST